MRLVVDTSVLVSELLRVAGRERLGDSRLELFLPEHMADDLRVELPRRVAAFARRRDLPSPVADQLVASALVLAAGIWTHDHDFLGAGVATWTTDTLAGWLTRQPS
jgi:predicted nucleic acid-binding protein